MNYLEQSFADPASNLACDEALLDFCESEQNDGVLRIWEPSNYFVVLGYSNRLSREVHVQRCHAQGVPILRRFSGGGTVLQGPGCVNYALALPNELLGRTVDLTASYQWVLQRHRKIFAELLDLPVEIAGTSDLALAGRKFSGNAQHRKRKFTLFHGTFLLNFDVSLIEALLPLPSSEPDYRSGRAHGNFLCNVNVDRTLLRDRLKLQWDALTPLGYDPQEAMRKLLDDRYNQTEWQGRF